MSRNMKIFTFIFIAFLQCSIVSAASEPLASDSTIVEFSFGESSFSYEIGFTSSEIEPEANRLDGYVLTLGDDGRGHDNDDLFIYWEITGKEFEVELSGSELKSGADPLSLDISWDGKSEDNNVVLDSGASIYSGKGIKALQLSTAPVTEAVIGSYDATLTLTIRRKS